MTMNLIMNEQISEPFSFFSINQIHIDYTKNRKRVETCVAKFQFILQLSEGFFFSFFFNN